MWQYLRDDHRNDLKIKYFVDHCSSQNISARDSVPGAALLSTCCPVRLPIVGFSGGMIRSWNLYQLFSGLWTPIKTKEDSPVFSQSVIINFGHNYSVIFVTRGCGWDDSAVARRWPETSWSRGYFLHNPGLGHRHWGWWNFLKKDREIKTRVFRVPELRHDTCIYFG